MSTTYFQNTFVNIKKAFKTAFKTFIHEIPSEFGKEYAKIVEIVWTT